MNDAKIDELRSEAKRQTLPSCGTFVNALELALKAITYAEKEKQRADEAKEELERWKRRADWLGTCYKDKTTAAGRIVIVLDGTKSATYPDDAEVIAGMIDKAMEDSDGLAEGLQSTKDRIVSLTAERDEVVHLLKWLKAIAESSGFEFRPGLNQQTDRILEIVEGK